MLGYGINRDLAELKETIDKIKEEHKQEMERLERMHKEELKVFKTIQKHTTAYQVQKASKEQGISPEEFIADAIVQKAYIPKGDYIKVNQHVLNRIKSIAKTRGQNIHDMTSHEDISEIILSALLEIK